LRRVRDHVASLADDYPSLQALAACPALYDEDAGFRILLGPDGDRTFADLEGIHGDPLGKSIEPEQVGPWFASWTDIVLKEAPKMREMLSDDKGDED
jgi:hypothetical protein